MPLTRVVRRAHDFGVSLMDYKELLAIVEKWTELLAFRHEGTMKDPDRRRPAQPSRSPRPT